jgi:hypothetical protein
LQESLPSRLRYKLWQSYLYEESLQFGWDKFWERPWFFVGAFLIIDIFDSNFQLPQYLFWPNQPDAMHIEPWLIPFIIIGVLFAACCLWSLGVIVQMGEKRLLLNAYEDVSAASFKDLWTTSSFLAVLLVAQILYALLS